MTSFAKFFGCVAGSMSMVRDINDIGPITFEWFGILPTEIIAEVSFDNINFIETAGEVTYLDLQEIWQLSYSPLDRPTSPGLVTYRFTSNFDETAVLLLEFIGNLPTNNPALDLGLTEYGPKRVKTKQMEIEQFDPRILDELDERKRVRGNGIPTFCSSAFCVGETREERIGRCSRP